MTRSEFEDAVMGKSPPEVKDALGMPDEAKVFTRFEEPRVVLFYNEITRDPSSGNVDPKSVVVFLRREVVDAYYVDSSNMVLE